MSTNTVEGLFHALQGDRALAECFMADPEAVLAEYPLTPVERRQILDWNVRALSDAGVNDMVTFLAFTTVFGQQGIPEYIKRLNTPNAPVAVAG